MEQDLKGSLKDCFSQEFNGNNLIFPKTNTFDQISTNQYF